MADMKTGIFAKNVQKRLNRAQEKVLQKLGKADETKDEQFEEYVQNFKRQEAEGSRLQRELRGYLAAIKGMQDASKKLTESLHEVYEPDWYGREDVKMIGEKCDELWEDFHQKLVDGSLLTLDTYLGQFPDIKTRIAKRSRKLVDYDSARHHLEALQSSKRKDEGRITKAEEEFQKAQKVFEEFNTDLQEELPTLWSRDSGPLRIAKTPSPPEEVSPLPSPTASPNHMLAPASPAPARPKSPTQLRKGPPVPPLPKLTPTKELQQENIINFFDDNFVPEINVTTPSQNEVPEAKKEESLLDLDFDPFKPEVVSTGVTHSPMSQTLPWDLWTTSSELVQPAPSAAFNGFAQDTSAFTVQSNENVTEPLTEAEEAPPGEAKVEETPAAAVVEKEAVPAEPGQPAEQAADNVEAGDKETTGVAEKESEGVPATEGAAAAEYSAAVAAGAGDGAATTEQEGVAEGDKAQGEEKEADVSQEKVSSIPSVVIEPASNNEGEGEEHEVVMNESEDGTAEMGTQGTDTSPSVTSQGGSEQKSTEEMQAAPSQDQPVLAEDAASAMPPGFLFKVEVLHDFEAANSDELNLKRGDIVLVIPSETTADQEAGWLTGIKESEWLQYRDANSYKGLFPENFTHRLD
ncbi:amphiphysin isoform X3 [Phalacrocorax aristotelis]|uniref:amphiphysin isoform X3 n=1 Tax=Phalacrocorax aristotelis TaxID=126867 RepID=UPI003F4C2B01